MVEITTRRVDTLGGERLSVIVPTEKDIPEATASSANGLVIQGELQPFFDIDGVTNIREQVVEGHHMDASTEVSINVENDQVDFGDINMFRANLQDKIDERIRPSEVAISPSLKLKDKTESSKRGVPKLIIIAKSNRGTEEEFREEVSEALRGVIGVNEITGYENIDGTNLAYAIGDVIIMKEIMEVWAKTLGPKNKSVMEIRFDVKIVE